MDDIAILVHLTAEKNVRSILRSGIKAERGVYCMPVLQDYYASHQWLRELKRGGPRSVVGVYFRLGSSEPVWVGRYDDSRVQMGLGRAIKEIMSIPDAEGYELIVPRSVEPGEIQRVRHLPQVLGWRYMPRAHGTRPCPCPVCLPRGAFKARRIRERADADS